MDRFKGTTGENDSSEEKDRFAGELAEADRDRAAKYIRPGGDAPLGELMSDARSRRLVRQLEQEARDRKMAAVRTADAELLLPEESGLLQLEDPSRKTSSVTQYELRENVDLRTAQKGFTLALDHFGPYTCSFTRNGTHLLLSGEKGHVASINWATKKLVKELHVKDMVYDSCFLQNETWFALAQSQRVHIYDKNGVELHILKAHHKSTRLEFLPYHWLLTSAGSSGWLHWTDVSSGESVSDANGRNGPILSLRQNPATAVLCAGHARGLITMWTPSMAEPTVKMMAHRGPVRALAFDRAGNTMVTAGVDSFVHVWDLRTYQKLRSFRPRRAASALDISQKGLLAVATGPDVEIFGSNILQGLDATGQFVHVEPFLRVDCPDRRNQAHSVRFCPWEDILGVGRLADYTSAIVPGSGEPNIDTFEANPFSTRNQRREADVHALLDKAPPSSIVMDPYSIGSVDPQAVRQHVEEEVSKFQPRMKSGGKNKSSFREKRKRIVSDAEALKARREQVYEEKMKEREAAASGQKDTDDNAVDAGKAKKKHKKKSVLDRFQKSTTD